MTQVIKDHIHTVNVGWKSLLEQLSKLICITKMLSFFIPQTT